MCVGVVEGRVGVGLWERRVGSVWGWIYLFAHTGDSLIVISISRSISISISMYVHVYIHLNILMHI